jgi:hypothetical protein
MRLFELASTRCPHCGGPLVSESEITEKKDACYHKVRSRYKVWPSAYASGALVQCRKKGAKNWGTKSSTSEARGKIDTDDQRPRTQRILRQLRMANPQATNDLEALILDYRKSQAQDRSDIGRLDAENDAEDAEIVALQSELDRLKKKRQS